MIKQWLTYGLCLFLLPFYGQQLKVNKHNIKDTIPIGKVHFIEVSIQNENIHLLDTSYYKQQGAKFQWLSTDTLEDALRLNISSLDTGYVVIGPLVGITSNNDTLYSEAILTYVNYPKVDMSKAPKQALPNQHYSLTLTEEITLLVYRYWWMAALVVAALIALWIWLNFRKRPKVEEVIEPVISIEEKYLQQLETLRKEQLWQKGSIKAYYTKVTYIVRSYIAEQFRIRALEFTSKQIISALNTEINVQPVREKINFLLSLSDMVKFAKQRPSDEENERIIDIAVEFIKQTTKQKQDN